MDADNLIGKSGSTVFRCTASENPRVQYECVPDAALIPTTDNLLRTTFSNGQTGEFFRFSLDNFHGVKLLLSTNGSIEKLKPNEGADTARTIPSNTTATLRAYAFAAETYGFIVGDQGIILSSNDGGNTWRHETQGLEGAAPNRRFPAGWYWVSAFLLILACTVVVAAPGPPPVTEASVADWAVTDAPLKPGDLDSLDYTPMALGLSRFIRNVKTQPPVTIAIEGEWGEGKSSVMALLQGDLQKSRFRPVWFNAWHHQSEDQLLAALLEHIKGQAIPPWWHIDNWIFRARLLAIRFGNKWPLAFLLVVAVGGGVTFELTRHGLHTDDFVQFGKDVVLLVKFFLPWSQQSTLPTDLGHFGLVATILAAFAAIFKKGQAFGIDPSKLVDNMRDAATIKDVKPEPGIRRQFAHEFGDLCQAWSWGSRRVIIFIDDLDRCRPESVVTILESINFLTTAGDCIIVLGMAQNQVTHCVGLGFKDIAQTQAAYVGGGNTEQEKAVARFKYGEFYIRKLVNIVAPLPKTDAEKRRLMLEVRARETHRKEEEKKTLENSGWRVHLWASLSQTAQIAFMAAPVVALLTVVAVSVLIGYNTGTDARKYDDLARQVAAQNALAAKSSPAVAQPTPKPSPAPLPGPRAKNEIAQPLAYNRPTAQPAALSAPDSSAGGVWSSYAVDGLFLLILFGILGYELSARTNQDAQNSPEFEESLKLWGGYIASVCDTPREIKRALNDLRYQAMMRRKSASSATRGERMARILRQAITGEINPVPAIASVDEAALPPLKAAALANMTTDQWDDFLDPDNLTPSGGAAIHVLTDIKAKHIKQFGRWIKEPLPETPEQNQRANPPGPTRQA